MARDDLLPGELLNEILAPFGRLGSAIAVSVEDGDGRRLAGTGVDPAVSPGLDDEASVRREIRSEGALIGHVTAQGRDATTPAVAAAIGALACALAALISETRAPVLYIVANNT